jgi:DNA end-binding protein Ku
MAARPIGSGTISFGLVSIPVKLFSTVDTTHSIHFNYLSKDGSRLKQQYIRASDGEVVERADQVQGYEFSKGQYVIFTPEEIKAFNVVATNAIDIAEFVPLESVERIYIEKVYYLGPDKGAARSYHLLKKALGTTGRAALANYAARGKSYLVLIRPMDDGLVMEQLKHREELRPFNEVPLDHVDVKDAELDLAIKIIEQRTNDKFEPEKYTDEIRAKIMAMIEQKVEGQTITVPSEEKSEAKIIDLMEALRASVGEKREAQAPRRPAKRAAKMAVEANTKTKASKRSSS